MSGSAIRKTSRHNGMTCEPFDVYEAWLGTTFLGVRGSQLEAEALIVAETERRIQAAAPSANERKRAARFKTALCAITAILDEVESDRLENDVDIDVDELIAGIRKQLRTAWGL